MKYLYTLFALCFWVLNFSTAHADNSETLTTYAYEWSDGSYFNNLVIEEVTAVGIPCFGGTRGTVTIEVSGATPPITYDIGVAGTVTVVDETYTFFQSLDAGTYNLTVTDADDCVTFETFVISEPPPLQITSTPIAETIPGAGDGFVSICVQGGTPSYIVTATPNVPVVSVAGTCDGNFEVDNLSEGTYTFTIQDENGCIANEVVTIDVGACDNVVSSVSTSSSLTICKDGMPDEVLMGNNIGGMVGEDYAYVLTDMNDVIVLWNQSANFYNIDLLTPGIYRIYGFNYQGMLTVPVGGSVNDITSSADCISLSQDFVQVEVIAQPSNAVAGTNITLCGPSLVTLSADSVAIGTGSWAQVSGAVAMIANSSAATTDVSGLVSGLYEFEWSVSNGICPPSRDTIEVSIALTAIEIDGITVVNETCNVDDNGSATITVSGIASLPITYDIGNQVTPVTTTDANYTFMSSLAAGNYVVTVTDAAGCSTVDSFTITQPDSLYIQPTVTAVTQVGMNDGLIVLCVEGGEEPFTLTSSSEISIDSIEGDCDGNYVIDSLAAGTYIFDLIDGIGCEVSETVVVAPGDCAIRIDSVIVNSDVSCFGENTGQLTVYADGGSGNYQFSIDNGGTFTAAPASLSFTNLTAGNYDIIVVDGLGCQDTFINNSITVIEPADFLVSLINTIDVSAPGANDGQIDFCVNGGAPPYTVTYSGMDTGASGAFTLISAGVCSGGFTTNNLPGDTYLIEIIDTNGCTEEFEVFVDDVDCTPFSVLNTTPRNVACNGDSTGTIEMTTSGGFAPYTFVIDNGTSTDTISGVNNANYTFSDLPMGSYTVTAIHSGDCAVQSTSFITENPPISASISTIDPTSVGGMDGEICITPTGGTASYTLTSSCGTPVVMAGNCGGTHHIAGLGAGECSITIVDGNGCIETVTAELISPSCANFSLVSVTPTDVACAGETDGLIAIEVMGGEPNYSYSIDGGNTFIQNANNEYIFENLSAGDYQIVVQDGLSCEDASFGTVTIDEPTPVSLEVETTITCADTNEGGIDITPSGGTGTYIYFWNTGDTGQDIDQLASGTYDLTVTDTNACMFSTVITVDEHPVIDVNLGNNQIIDANDSIQLMPNISAMQNYDFTWTPTTGLNDPLSLTPWASPSITTTYTLTVLSEEGCATSDDVIISVNPVRQVVAVPSAFTPNADGENDELNVIIQGNFDLTSFHVFNRWGEEVFFTENASTGWNGTYKGEQQPVGTYVYVIRYEDTSGAIVEEGGDVTLLR